MWSIGTIFAEMVPPLTLCVLQRVEQVTKQPLFAGDSEIDEIFHIFQCVAWLPVMLTLG